MATTAPPGVTPPRRHRLPRPAPLALTLAAVLTLGAGWVAATVRLRRMRAEAREVTPLDLDVDVPGSPPPLRLRVLGDSAAAGHGLDDPEQAYARRVAWRLAGRGQAVRVRSAAVDGATTAEVLATQADTVDRDDIVLVSAGVNDAFRPLTPRYVAVRTCELLAEVRRRAPAARVVLLTCPDLSGAIGLPGLLRPLIGWRCRVIAAVQARAAAAAGVATLPIDRSRLLPEVFGADGFHPGAIGHDRIARRLVDEHLATLVGV